MYAECLRLGRLSRALFVIVACGLLVAPALAQHNGAPRPKEEAASELVLRVGEQHVLSTEGVQSYSEAVRGVVDVRLTKDASQFVIVALAPGSTTLLLLMRDGKERHYRITVADDRESGAPRSVSGPGPVQARDNVRLDFYFVQLDKSYQHRVGVAWPTAVGGGAVSATYDILSQRFESATAIVSNQPLPRLDMAQASGHAKLMRHAAVITANGEKASFGGGGEVNIPVQGGLGTGIHQISFGSTIGVAPRYDAESGRIELVVHAEVSDLSDDRGTGAPGRTTATLDTVVNLELGQSLVLAGLTASSEAKSRAGLPLLSQIPVLGLFFGTNSAARQDTENIVVIVPSVVDASTADARKRLGEALRLYEEYSGDIERSRLIDEPKQGAPSPVAR
jgi:pilus assembly protein CpaC